MKILKNDLVKITIGKDSGRQGQVLKVLPKRDQIIIKDLNVYVRHFKKQGQQEGQKITRERPINLSKVALICPKCKQPTRVGYKFDAKNIKRRICRKCGSYITTPKKPSPSKKKK